jgi:hypothetical protein
MNALVAVAIAAMPAIGGAATVTEAIDSSLAAAADECCGHGGMPCDQRRHDKDGCASIAACAVKCFNYVGVSSCAAPFAPAGTVPLEICATPALVSHTDPPPFPPPRA